MFVAELRGKASPLSTLSTSRPVRLL